QTAALPAHTPPEILEADLSGLLLDCAAFGVSDPASLRFLDAPPAPALAEARALLTTLGGLDEAGRLTGTGAGSRGLALPVRPGGMVDGDARAGDASQGAQVAVLLTGGGLGGDSTDLELRLMPLQTDSCPPAVAARRLAERLSPTDG